jgi:hypothetical protein
VEEIVIVPTLLTLAPLCAKVPLPPPPTVVLVAVREPPLSNTVPAEGVPSPMSKVPRLLDPPL